VALSVNPFSVACAPPALPYARSRTARSRTQVVKTAEQQLLARELSGAENKEYLAMDGLPAFNKLTAQLLFGADAPALKEGRVATIQGLSVRSGRAVCSLPASYQC
jgi:aspartate/tyrosine/aromatic aminotransferase